MTPEREPTFVPQRIHEPYRVRLAAEPLPSSGRAILIRAGLANGLQFSEECLSGAAALFADRPSFVDHGADPFAQRSVRDLVGHITNPAWDPIEQAITANYTFYSIAGDLRQLIAEALDKGYVGLSADLWLTRQEDAVVAIRSVESVDIVIHPAAGGHFLFSSPSCQSCESCQSLLKRMDPDVGGGVDRDKIPQEDCAGKAGSFPIVTPQDVADAAASMGRAGNDNYDKETIQRNIIRIAKRKGPEFVARLPKSWVLNAVKDHNQKESTMPEQETLTAPAPAIAPAPSLAPPAGGIGGSDLAAVRQELAQLKIRQSGLPQTLQDKLHGRLATIPGYPASLDGDIEILRELQAELASRDTIRGLGQISNVMNSADRISLAFEKLMGLPVSQAVERLSGIREMYDILTGDWERRGIFQPERVRFAEATTTTMAHVVANVLNKVLVNSFEMRPQWWKPIATEMDFPTMQDPKWITIGGFPDLDTVAEGGAYTEKSWGDMNETASFVKKGNYLGITLEMIDRDDVAAVRQVPRRLGLAAARTLASSIAAIFTTNANLHDAVALFHGTHANLLTTALSADAWDTVVQAMFKQPELTSSKRLGVRPRYCLVPIELEKTALTIFTSELESGTMDNDINARRMSSDAVIVVPEWTDADNWYAAASPMDLETIMVGYRFGRQPELFVADNELMGSMFTNDEMRIKVRFIYVVGIGDYRGLHRNTVT